MKAGFPVKAGFPGVSFFLLQVLCCGVVLFKRRYQRRFSLFLPYPLVSVSLSLSLELTERNDVLLTSKGASGGY